jgi:hypothetical protein
MPGLYLYGVVPAAAGEGLDAVGLDDRPVRVVVHGALGVVVSEAREEELLGRRRELLRHAEVIEQALRHGPVLPLRFGAMADTDADVVEEILAPRHDELLALLEEMHGRVEVRLRGFYDEQAVLAELVARQPQLQHVGSTMDERVDAGGRIARALEAQRDEDAAAIIARLAPLAVDVVREAPATEMMALNAAFLLEEDDLTRFDEAVRAIGAEVEGRLRLKYVGPVPPASFIDLALPE